MIWEFKGTVWVTLQFWVQYRFLGNKKFSSYLYIGQSSVYVMQHCLLILQETSMKTALDLAPPSAHLWK